jgi:hypothetical protein
MLAYEKIAKILRSDKNTIRLLEEKLGALTGKKGVTAKIIEENESAIRNRLDFLGLGRKINARKISDALISKIEADDAELYEALGEPSVVIPEDWQRVLEISQKVSNNPKGFFLKEKKAEEFLRNQPPHEILKVLGYKNVDEMLQKENVFEIYSALRFVEGNEWLNEIFFKQYENIKPDDFELREIKVLALPKRWSQIAQNFIRHKHHNISHLKELGLIYAIPLSLEISGETMRNFALVLHYFNEIEFYSDLFEKFSRDAGSFAKNLISLLRGDVIERHLSPGADRIRWLIIQRYLAKDDENDWRLFEPHVNPEAVHWEKAEKILVKAGETLNSFSGELAFWEDLNWVGDYFNTEAGIDVLVSFNLVDTVMSLVKEKEFIKYLYHHQEALWNKIFTEYFGEEKMEELIKENIIKGWFEA